MRAQLRRAAAAAGVTASLVTASVVLSASSAVAAPPAPVAIQTTLTQVVPTFAGVWQASGAIQDSGTFVRTDANVTGSVLNSPVVGAVQVELVFSGARGTFTIRDELVSTLTSIAGTWQIESGTGSYARASGHGTSDFVFPTIVFSGVVSS
jgi:hypothetical protein